VLDRLMPPRRNLALTVGIGVVVALAACGGASDDSPSGVDAAAVQDSNRGDAVNDPCYRELHDPRNGTSAEPTGLARGVGPVAICGAIEIDHPGGRFLDVDQYEIAVTLGGNAVVRLVAPGASALTRVDLIVNNASGRIATGRVVGGLGVIVLPLAAGSHTLVVEAQGSASAAVPYQIEIVDDDPALRCPIAGDPRGDYHEADERAAGNRANDVVSVRTEPALLTSLTALSTDAPELTKLAVSSGGRQLIDGVSADVATAGDDYHDRDTFAVYTGQGTNLLELRARWPGTSADLDLFVFEADHADDPMGRPVQLVTGELLVTAVKPRTLYWIWVGGSTRSAQLPAAYTLAICGHELALGAGFSH